MARPRPIATRRRATVRYPQGDRPFRADGEFRGAERGFRPEGGYRKPGQGFRPEGGFRKPDGAPRSAKRGFRPADRGFRPRRRGPSRAWLHPWRSPAAHGRRFPRGPLGRRPARGQDCARRGTSLAAGPPKATAVRPADRLSTSGPAGPGKPLQACLRLAAGTDLHAHRGVTCAAWRAMTWPAHRIRRGLTAPCSFPVFVMGTSRVACCVGPALSVGR